jgi:hypothetical protein
MEEIALRGGTIVIGGTELLIQQIRNVDVAFHIPRRSLVMIFIGVAVFIGTALIGAGFSLLRVLYGNDFLSFWDPHRVPYSSSA